MTDATEPGWVDVQACTLPEPDRPARLAEFDALFTSLTGVRRAQPAWLRLRFPAGAEERVRDLVARESRCCTFFDFDVRRRGGDVVLDVRVPRGRIGVLDALGARAEAARGSGGR